MGSESEEYSNWEDAFAPDELTEGEKEPQASNEPNLSEEQEETAQQRRISPKMSSSDFLDISKPPQHPSMERNKRQQKIDKNAKYRPVEATPSPERSFQQKRKRFGMYSRNRKKNLRSQKRVKADVALRKENKRLRTKLREFSLMLDKISLERNIVHHEPKMSRDRIHDAREIESLQRENTMLQKQCEGLKLENDESKKRLGHLRDALRIAKTVAYNKDRDCRKQHATIESYKAKAKKLKRELADLRMDKKATEKSGAEVREEYEEMIKVTQNKQRKQKMKLQKRSLAQQNEIKRLQEVIEQRQTIIDNTLKQVGKFEKVLERQKTQISHLKKMQKRSNRRKIKQQSKIKNIANAIQESGENKSAENKSADDDYEDDDFD